MVIITQIFTDFREGKSVNNLEELFLLLLLRPCWTKMALSDILSVKFSKIELNIVNYDENKIYN